MAILKSEIRSIEVKKGLFGDYVQVNHVSRDIFPPLALYVSPHGDVGRAIEILSGRAIPMSDASQRPIGEFRLDVGSQLATDGNKLPLIVKMLMVFGLLVNFGLLVLGLFWAIPSLGFFGVLWTIVMLGIAIFNVYTFIFRFRRR